MVQSTVRARFGTRLCYDVTPICDSAAQRPWNGWLESWYWGVGCRIWLLPSGKPMGVSKWDMKKMHVDERAHHDARWQCIILSHHGNSSTHVRYRNGNTHPFMLPVFLFFCTVTASTLKARSLCRSSTAWPRSSALESPAFLFCGIIGLLVAGPLRPFATCFPLYWITLPLRWVTSIFLSQISKLISLSHYYINETYRHHS